MTLILLRRYGGLQRRTAERIAAAVVGLTLCSGYAEANDPDKRAVECLISVLRAAPNYVSLEAADDWPTTVAGNKIISRGVKFRFRALNGEVQSADVYLGTEFERIPDKVHVPPAAGFLERPANNGRYSVGLRPPYPSEWYPPARKAKTGPGEYTYLRQDSPQHPLYPVWRKLADKCHADNLHLTSPTM